MMPPGAVRCILRTRTKYDVSRVGCLSRYISNFGDAPALGSAAAGAAGTGVCGYPAPSLCRRGLTFRRARRLGSAPGIGIQIGAGAVVIAVVGRPRRRVEDGVFEATELPRKRP